MANKRKDLCLKLYRCSSGHALKMTGKELPQPFGSFSINVPICQEGRTYSADFRKAKNENGDGYEGNPQQIIGLSEIANSYYVGCFIKEASNSGEIPKETSISIRYSSKNRRFGRMAENERHKGWRETHYTSRDD